MSITFPAIGRADFTGRNGIGSIGLPGAKVGDLVLLQFFNGGGAELPTSRIESIISVADEIQQTSAVDWTGVPFTILFLRST